MPMSTPSSVAAREDVRPDSSGPTEAQTPAEPSATPGPPTEEERIYHPSPGERQLTVRAVVVGSLLGGIVSCMNVYIGLKIGWSFGASLIAAILGFSAFSLAGKNLTVLETNITQTAGSASGTMASAAGLIACIPAMQLIGHTFAWHELLLWALAVAYLGVFFAVPLRRQMVEVDKLRYPSGTATAETIVAMFAEAKEALAKARALLWTAAGAGAFALAQYFIPQLEKPPIEALGIAALTLAATWGFKLYLGPLLFGAGILIGPRVGISLLAGAVVAWAVIGPIAQAAGWAPGEVMSYTDGPRGWLLWPGVGIMVSEALTTLAMSWKTFVRALKGVSAAGSAASSETDPERIPNSWWLWGLGMASIATVIIAALVFDIPWYLSLIAIALSAVLATVAVRSTGETDINPVGGMGKVTQLVYGGIAPGSMATNLMAAGITGAGASQSADMMQDLKAGRMLGAAPRKQFIAQLFGIAAGVVFCVPVYYFLTGAYDIGGDKLPAPAALAWKAMAEVLTQGLGALPPNAAPAALGGILFGASLPLLRKSNKLAPYVPSGLAFGISFIIPAYYAMVIFFGSMALVLWRYLNPESVKRLSFAVASGFIVGGGLMGLVKAGMTLLGVPTLTGGGGGH
jgi:putative OPT family oligopeptide transporter